MKYWLLSYKQGVGLDSGDELGSRSVGKRALLSSFYHLFLISTWNEDMMGRIQEVTGLSKVALRIETLS